jgi:SAM-dependent methyltransferase
MTQPPEDLALITAKTLEHYNEHAADFWNGTRDHDVTQNIEALLRHIRAAPPLCILDLGCGPGRDLAAFRALGHEPIGLEGSRSADRPRHAAGALTVMRIEHVRCTGA